MTKTTEPKKICIVGINHLLLNWVQFVFSKRKVSTVDIGGTPLPLVIKECCICVAKTTPLHMCYQVL
jgi:hypothetical protein